MKMERRNNTKYRTNSGSMMVSSWSLSVLLLLVLASTDCVCGVCYFPVEYQGIFATQSSISSISEGAIHEYSQVTILPDAIPVWGVCHKKFANNVILRDPSGGEDCYRCFHISLHSGNVIQIHTEGLNRCYSTEASAIQTCPTLHTIQARRVSEIMLYKSRSFTQDGLIDRVFCPISGRYRFTYDVNDGTETTEECPEPSSELSNCPRGSELQLRFRRCSFGELDMGLRCLGDWRGHDGQRYLALWDPQVTTHNQPRYRCAMYSEDASTGRVYLSFSIDATCTNHLHTPWDGYETMVLTPLTAPAPPAVVHTTACAFPNWAQGAWQHLQINGNELWVEDSVADKKYTTLCLSQHAPHGERYALYSTSQCGEEVFTCLWIKKRAVNVMEYQMAAYPSSQYNASRICSDDMFRGQTWITQGKLTPENLSGCPITGEYTGVIPDAKELCARLSSDCTDPQHMRYTVSSCFNHTEVFEEGADGEGTGEGGPHATSTSPRRQLRSVFLVSDPHAPHAHSLGRATRHAHRHHATHHPSSSSASSSSSWARSRASELMGSSWPSDRTHHFTTIGGQSRRSRARDRPPKQQVYVFPDAATTDTGGGGGSRSRSSVVVGEGTGGGVLAQAQTQSQGQQKPLRDRHDPSLTPTKTSPPTTATTTTDSTRLPYPHERPFYYLVESEEKSAWDHLRGLHPVTIEEREYRCLGQWSEGGVMYTYTHRRDVDTYECFAGVVVSPNEIFIIEAGTSCQRGLQPLAHGMKLVRQATCSEIEARTSSTPRPPHRHQDPSASRPPWWPPTTKNPWVKKTTEQPPTWRNEVSRAAHSSSAVQLRTFLPSCLLTVPLVLLLLPTCL